MTLTGALFDLIVTLVISLAALGYGWWILRLLDVAEQNIYSLWLATVYGLGGLSVGTLLIGMIGLLYPFLFVALLTPLAIYGLFVLVSVKWWIIVLEWLTKLQHKGFLGFYSYILLFISVSSVIWIILTHALMPPHEWDEIAYHLTLPKLYININRIIYIPFMVPSNWPLNNEMLFGIALMFGSDIASHLLMLMTTLLSGLGLMIIARRYFDDRVGIVALTLLLIIPLVKRLAGTGLIDVALGMYVLAALVTFNRWQNERHWPWLVLCGAFCGFAAGSKLMGGGFAILLGLLWLGDELHQRPLRIGMLLRHGMLFGLAGLLMVGPWYARSFLFTGNPIWPFAYHILGGRDWDALGDEYHMHLLLETWTPSIDRDFNGLLLSFFYLMTDPSVLGGYRGGIGVVLPIGTLWTTFLIRSAPQLLRQSLFVCAGFYLLWFTLVSLQVRYLLPIAPLLSLATAYGFIWFLDHSRLPVIRIALLVGLLLIIFQEWPWILNSERLLLNARLPYLRGQISRDTWLDMHVDVMPILRYANTNLPSDVHILLLPYENRTYALDRNYIWGNPISQRIIPFEKFNNVQELAIYLHNIGITHVIDNPTWIYDGLRHWFQIRTLMLQLKERCGKPIYQHGEGLLYALSDCKETTQLAQ